MYSNRDLAIVDLTEFVAGFPGTQSHPLFGAEFRVVDVLVYRDGLAVDWVIRPKPELSSITVELSDDDHRSIARLPERLRHEATEGRQFGWRLWSLVEAATLSDDVGTEYRSGSWITERRGRDRRAV